MRLCTSRAAEGFLWLLVIAISLVCAAEEVNLDREHPGQGPLGMTLDYHLAREGPGVPNQRHINHPLVVFSTHLQFKDKVDGISNGQLVQLALDGLSEMQANGLLYNIKAGSKSLPGVVTALAFGNEVILSSSQKGSRSFTYDFGNNPVRTALQRCMATTKPHRTLGKCGEQLAAHMYYRVHPRGAPGSRPLPDVHSKAITVQIQKDGSVKAVPPCGSENDPGCMQFVENQWIDYIDDQTHPEGYDVKTLAGGLQRTKQPTLCAKY